MQKLILYAFGSICLLLIFMYRYTSVSNQFVVGEEVVLSGHIKTEPRIFEDSQLIVVDGLRFFLPKHPRLYMGEFIKVSGTVGEKNILKNPQIITLELADNPLFVFRKNTIGWIARNFPPESAALIAGTTLGSKALMRESFWGDLVETGTAHVVVASGMNVVMVGSFVFSCVIVFFRRKKALIVTVIFVFLYVVLSGFEAPLVRAFVMYSLTLVGQLMGRITYSFRILIITGLSMIFFSPHWIMDWGFILSFSATLSLMLFESKVQKRVHFVPGFFRNSLSSTLSAQILVAPLLLIAFGRVSFVSPVVNTLVLFVIPPITLLGMCAALVQTLFPLLASVFVFPLYILSWWFVMIVNIFSGK